MRLGTGLPTTQCQSPRCSFCPQGMLGPFLKERRSLAASLASPALPCIPPIRRISGEGGLFGSWGGALVKLMAGC